MKLYIYKCGGGRGQSPITENINIKDGDSPYVEKRAMAIYEEVGPFIARDPDTLNEVLSVVYLTDGKPAYTWG